MSAGWAKVRNIRTGETFFVRIDDITDSSEKIKCFDKPYYTGCHSQANADGKIVAIYCFGKPREPKSRLFLKKFLEVVRDEKELK